MTPSELVEFTDMIHQMRVAGYDPAEESPPQYFVMGPNDTGLTVVVGLAPGVVAEQMVRDECQRRNAVAVGFSCEAWLANAGNARSVSDGRLKQAPADDPNRVTGVVTYVVDTEGKFEARLSSEQDGPFGKRLVLREVGVLAQFYGSQDTRIKTLKDLLPKARA